MSLPALLLREIKINYCQINMPFCYRNLLPQDYSRQPQILLVELFNGITVSGSAVNILLPGSLKIPRPIPLFNLKSFLIMTFSSRNDRVWKIGETVILAPT